MTLKFSYGHGSLDDCADTADWTKYTAGGIQGSAFSCLYEDYFKLEGTLQDIINEYVYVEKDLSTLSLNTTLYTTAIIRYKTSASPTVKNALGAQAKIIYSDASTQYLLGVNASDSTPQFSTSWTRKITTLLSGKTISKIQLIADDYPDSTQSGTSQVYFDFALICKGIMTFPFVNEAYKVSLPKNRYAQIPIIDRVGNESQWLGADLATVHAAGTMDTNNAWKGPNGIVGEALQMINHNASSEPWQWFEDGKYKFKVTPSDPFDLEPTDKAEAHYDVNFTEFRQCSGDYETYYERFGLI